MPGEDSPLNGLRFDHSLEKANFAWSQRCGPIICFLTQLTSHYMFLRTTVRTIKESALTAVLLVVALVGLWAIESHAFREEPKAVVQSQWPAQATLASGAGKFQCILFVHPHCPCSRVALAVVKQHVSDARAADEDWQIVFVQPANVASDWHLGTNWQQVQEMSGVQCVLDSDGRNAQAFGAVASGHCFIFDDSGHKVFDGGLTAGRGMEGISLGQKSLASLLTSSPLASGTAPVYGCRLLGFEE